MNFSKQLKIYRERDGLSQEELTEKIYVTRQTISKGENDHTYPDIHNVIALLFANAEVLTKKFEFFCNCIRSNTVIMAVFIGNYFEKVSSSN